MAFSFWFGSEPLRSGENVYRLGLGVLNVESVNTQCDEVEPEAEPNSRGRESRALTPLRTTMKKKRERKQKLTTTESQQPSSPVSTDESAIRSSTLRSSHRCGDQVSFFETIHPRSALQGLQSGIFHVTTKIDP
jgi:hypothetical protein